jgi:hypothetical protein
MKVKNFSENSLYWLTLLIAVCFFLIFSGRFLVGVDFWSLFATGLLVYLMVVLWLDPLFSKLISGDFGEKAGSKILIGLVSAILLYGVFFAGNIVLRYIFPETLEHLASIYNLKFGSSSLRIGIFLTLIIGPGEELLWRGFLQRHWAARLGKEAGFLAVALLYAAVHLSTRNPLLVLAALGGGLWWGYQYLKFNSLLVNVVSHLLWDLLVFIIFPFI